MLGWSLLGCPRRDDAGPDASTVIGFPTQRAAPHGCSLRAPRFHPITQSLVSPWLIGGPEGPRVLGLTSPGRELFWRDAHDPPVEATVSSELSLSPRGVGWSGRGFVGVAGGRATFTDARFASPRPVRRLSLDRAMALSMASREGAVLVGWLQERHVDDGEGTPWVALVGADGELLMDPRPLMGAPGLMQSMEVRWDFGRFVVQGVLSGDNSLWAWVLEPDGRDNRSEWGRVVCPVSGCVRVELAAPGGQAPSEPDSQLQLQPEGPPQVLRLVPLHHSAPSVDTNILTRDLLALAVSGDRLLVLHSPIEGVGSCAIHVYDVGHRVVAHESSSPTLSCAPGSAIATPAGFSLLEVHPSQGVAVRALSCGDDS